MIEEKDLVVLMYAPNVCYTNVVDFGAEGTEKIELDFENEKWHYEKGFRSSYITPIGRARPEDLWGSRGGIIGVYDKTDTKHLSTMVSDAREATRGRSVISD